MRYIRVVRVEVENERNLIIHRGTSRILIEEIVYIVSTLCTGVPLCNFLLSLFTVHLKMKMKIKMCGVRICRCADVRGRVLYEYFLYASFTRIPRDRRSMLILYILIY